MRDDLEALQNLSGGTSKVIFDLAKPEGRSETQTAALAAAMGGSVRAVLLAIAAAFSGGGKTLFTTNVEHELLMRGQTVYHIGLETPPAIVRLHFACLKLGYYVGDVVSGEAKHRADWPEMERALRAEINAGFRADYPLLVNRDRWLDVPRLRRALKEAAFWMK